MISLIMCSRVQGNNNNRINYFLDSLRKQTYYAPGIELLIKFDDDDDFSPIIRYLKDLPFRCEYFVGPRLNGYTSIHKGYQQLLSHTHPESRIVGAVADDMYCCRQNWDDYLRNATQGQDYFVVHGRPHPVTKPEGNPSLRTVENVRDAFNIFFDIRDMANLYVIDEAPFWSRAMLKLFNDDMLLSFTDAWTLAFEQVLFHRYGIKITNFTPMLFARTVHPVIDGPENKKRWEVERKGNFDYIGSHDCYLLLEEQARLVANAINRYDR